VSWKSYFSLIVFSIRLDCDKEGNQSSEIKVMVDEAREITTQQAQAYQATGRKLKLPKERKSSAVPVKLPAKQEEALARVYIRLVNSNDQDVLLSLKQTIDTHRGDTEVVLVLGESNSKQAIKLPGGIDKASDGVSKLKSLVGSDNLVIR
jgi:glucan phosphoethanolaminetransferase (alkaline phosphatase superfamily)